MTCFQIMIFLYQTNCWLLFGDFIWRLRKNTQVDDFLQGGYGVLVSGVVKNKEPFSIFMQVHRKASGRRYTCMFLVGSFRYIYLRRRGESCCARYACG